MIIVKRGKKTADFLLADAAPYLMCFALLLIPYLIFQPSPLYPLELIFTKPQHVLACSALITFLAIATWAGWAFGRQRLRVPVEMEISPIYGLMLWGLLIISVGAHVAMIAGALPGYLHGGFIGARKSFLFQGLGVFMRLYMPVIPILVVTTTPLSRLKPWLIVLFVLVLVRSTVLSERLAVIEYLLTMWVAAKAIGYSLKLRTALLAGLAIVLLFAALVGVRLVQQRDARIRTGAGEFAAVSTIAYYADTQNKLYYYATSGRHFPIRGYTQPIDALTHNKGLGVMQFQSYLDRMSTLTRAINSGLNNPGGMNLMVGDFGLWGGLFVTCLGFAFSGWVIATIRAMRFSLLFAPLMLMQITDFPRENYLELPFCAYTAVLVIIMWLLQNGTVARVYASDLRAERPRTGGPSTATAGLLTR